MKKKILPILIALLFVTALAVPAMAKQDGQPIEYFRKVEDTINVIGHSCGESGNYIVQNSTRKGSIYEGTDMSGPKLFDFTQYGSCEMNLKQQKATWHFYMVFSKPTDLESGFKGKLNGDAMVPPAASLGWYTVNGVLQGYGEFAGQKLVVEMARAPPNDAQITGVLITK